MIPPVLNAQMSRAQIAIYHMRCKGTLDQLTGDGELNEKDLEAEWQHKLEISPDWQEKMDGMADRKKKNFLRHKRDAFVEGIRKAFARAQAKVDAGCLAQADDGGKNSVPARPGSEGTDALTGSHQDRLKELDGLQPVPSRNNSKISRTAFKQGLSPKEYEALALAMFNQNRMHQENPDEPKVFSKHDLSQVEEEAQVLARIKKERKHQYESADEYLLHQESLHQESLYKKVCKRKKEKRKRQVAAFDASLKKFNANQTKKKKLKSKKEAFKASKEEAKERKREALEAEKQAKADGSLQEALAHQRREARKERRRAAFEANPHAKDEREQRNFGFRYFPTEKAHARAQKQLSGNEALEKKNAALGDASASDVVWQAVKSFGDYMFSLAHPAEVKPTGTRDG